ncbi:hypothetical protein AA103196_3092 [Ameyamaea chiangmaiensis NBRC 103196]|uniref:Uncharacterized protein n=1 Tax=Ameyamaea chiangmaiensis TaxID=442969 RepID=A0A850P8M7_9PROT|nr:hypothetical protein [Ameyamaea chiangmaiensis]MBS4074577.1 hypothetical protein [Ameyamaea chiangmaiensis]NVN39333.1 hypothetical protein [Ameyamaea chiangmaiensis]GBQ72547.1 hypothetical protein AA103196_3092 [Ameyamaea chiangmaiensis NBRC 103196]
MSLNASDVALIGTACVSVCAVVARFWPRPADGSKWLPIYNLVNQIAQNGGHAANADDASKKDIGHV